MTVKFDFQQAFQRNIGWVTRAELEMLRGKRVAVAGLGGGGGVYVTTLARLGVGKLSIADFDKFELANFNRQAGARMSTIGRPKIDVVAEMARDINPEIELRSFADGVHEGNVNEFLDGCDVFVDALDMTALSARRKVYARCREIGVPIVLALPAGMGFVFFTFTPDGMSLEEWCRFEDAPPGLEMVQYVAAILPDPTVFLPHMVEPSAFNPGSGVGPSLGIGLELCAGVMIGQTAKLLLGRGVIDPVPYYFEFDVFNFVFRRNHMPLGNRDPRQLKRLAEDYERFKHLRKGG